LYHSILISIGKSTIGVVHQRGGGLVGRDGRLVDKATPVTASAQDVTHIPAGHIGRLGHPVFVGVGHHTTKIVLGEVR